MPSLATIRIQPCISVDVLRGKNTVNVNEVEIIVEVLTSELQVIKLFAQRTVLVIDVCSRLIERILHGAASTPHIALIHLLCLIPSSKHLCHCKLRIGLVKATVLVRLHLAIGQNGRHRAFLQRLGSLLKDVADLLGLLTGHIEE